MYYSEIGKIIEAGLAKDREKVISFAQLLAKKMENDGDTRTSQRITTVLNRYSCIGATTDSLTPPPVDQESRMNIIDIEPNPETIELILTESVTMKLNDFIETIKNMEKMNAIGLDFNMSLLLYGPPGCGKTSVAAHIAKEMGLPLVTAKLDTLISSLLGNTAKNIHKVFDFAKRQPCVLFLDEFDAIAKARDDQHELGELKRVVNSLLQNMDEYCKDGILIAATNHSELLDDAIWRRFQTVIELPKPEREEIRKMLSSFDSYLDVSNIKEVQWNKVVECLYGLSYSDIKNVINTSVKKRVLADKMTIDYADIISEAYMFTHHGNFKLDDLVKFMVDSGVPKKHVMASLDISRRKVDTIIDGSGE